MRRAAIGDIVEDVSTWNPRNRSSEDEFVYIDLGALDATEKKITNPSRILTTDAPSRARQIVLFGDVLVSTVRPNLNAVATVPREFDGMTASTGFCVLRPGPDVDGRFLFHWVRSRQFVAEMTKLAKGANYPAVSDRIIKNSTLLLPAIDEQRRIAAILDRVDTLRRNRSRTISLVDSARPALFSEILSTARFPEKALGDVAEVWDCPHSTPRWTSDGIRCLRTSNLTRGGWNWSDTRYVDEEQFNTRSKGGGARPGDVILSREGTVGIAAIVQSGMRVCMGQRLVQVRPLPSELNSEWMLEFLLAALHPDRISHVMVGSTARHLNVKDLRTIRVPLPPMEVQRSFAHQSSSINAIRRRIERAGNSDNELLATLQGRAFRGEL